MAYFERTLKELHDNIDKLTDHSLSDNELDERCSLSGQLDFSETWAEADFKLLDGAVGIVLENKLTDDFRDIRVQFQTKLFDVVKCGLVTPPQLKKNKEIKLVFTKLNSLQAHKSVVRCKAEQYKKYDSGRYCSPISLLYVYRTRLNFIGELMNAVSKLEADLSDIITKLMFS